MQWLLLTALLAPASSQDIVNSLTDGELQSKHCVHGVFNTTTKSCDCFEGWSSAGITDTLDFLEGVCEQYHCQSDEICQKVLGIPYATCPVKNWNCYCGWSWSLKNFGHGWETPHKHGGGECMGLMYTISVSSAESIKWVLKRAWIGFLSLAVLLLPFGRNRSSCDHHRPSMSNCLRGLLGQASTCRGECVLQPEYNTDRFLDDIAWTAFMLELGVWFCIFLTLLLLIVLFIWSVVLWAAVLVILLVLVIVSFCMLTGQAAEGLCAGNGAACGEVSCCCPFGADMGHGSFQPSSTDIFYFNAGGGGYDVNCCGADNAFCANCCCCWRPLAWLVYVFPKFPENAWGGFVGRYVMGTHHMTPAQDLYQGNHPVVEFLRMGWCNQGSEELYSDESWRGQVRDFLLGGPQLDQPGASLMLRSANTRRGFSMTEHYQQVQQEGEDAGQQIIEIGRTHAVKIMRPFDEHEDACVPSSFQDYQQNQCWICMSEGEEWDMWMSCHHMYCSRCSTQMLLRRMPCPLCRVASSVVKRGFLYHQQNSN